MHDLNFFEPLTKGRPKANATGSMLPLIIFLVLLLSAWPLTNFGYKLWLDRRAEAAEAEILANPNYPLAEAEAARQYVIRRTAQFASLQSTDTAIKEGEWLDEPLFYSLLSTVPKDVLITYLAIAPEKTISLSGTASGKPAIAELASNLRKAGRFDSILVTSITNDKGAYQFNLEFALKDGEN